MSLRSSTAFVAHAAGAPTSAPDQRAGLKSVRNALVAMSQDDASGRTSNLLRDIDAVATAQIIMFRTLRSVGEKLRAGVPSRQVACEIESLLRRIDPPARAARPPDPPMDCAGEGEV